LTKRDTVIVSTRTMAETVIIDRPSVTKPVSRTRSRKPATVSASALAQHFDCSRAYLGKLEADGVIQRQGNGFPVDQSRVAYLRYLRREHRHSPRSQADADHVKVKTEMLQMRLMEKRRELVRRDGAREARARGGRASWSARHRAAPRPDRAAPRPLGILTAAFRFARGVTGAEPQSKSCSALPPSYRAGTERARPARPSIRPIRLYVRISQHSENIG
jgi:hypothetical protein